MRRPLLLLALVLLAAARPAAAVCTAADVMACGSSCWKCTGFTCTIAKLLPVTRAACTFDFGARNIVLAGGGFSAGANAFEIKAHGLTVSFDGTLKATGNRDTHGGTITLTLGAAGLTVLPGANVIDLTGARLAGISPGGGGTFSVFSDGDITLGGPDIVVDGTTTDADGGMIHLNAGRLSGTSLVASGSITVRANLSAMAKTNGSGGTVMLVANGSGTSGRIDVEQRVDVTGGAGGGTINLMSSGDTILGTTPSGGPLLLADANGDGSDGGEIDVAAGGQVRGNNGATGPLRARGSAGFFPGDPGGFGGTFCIDATGALTLGGSSGVIDASGGQSGCGGCIQLATENSGADLTLAVPLFVDAGGIDGAAGEVDISADGRAILRGDINASAAVGCGILCIAALSDITLDAPAQAIRADGPDGAVMLCAGRDVVLGSPLVSAAATSTLSGDEGGSLCVASSRNITANGPVNVSASGPNAGGMIDVEACRDLSIGGASTLDADGGQGGGSGGAIFLLAGGFGFPGDATLSGQAHARGTAAPGAAAADLTGCTIHVGPTGLLDTRGDARARNTLKARTGLRVDAGALIATTGGAPTSRNFVTLPVGAPTASPGIFSPPLAPGDVQFQPICTPSNQPPGCLPPCPACGNGRVEYPETCDNGLANGPCRPCNANCRTMTCDDQNPCTIDACDPLAGCTRSTIPGCTTTTSTSPGVTSTTAIAPTTTTSPAATTSTTTVTQTTSTTSTTVAPSSTTTASSSTTTSTSSTAATSSTTSTTAPPECTADTPGACDDHDRCTRDTCVAGRCVHAPLASFDAVLCRLDGLTAAMQAAPATAVGGSRSQHKLETGVARARAFTVAGQAAQGRRRARQLGKAQRKLAAFIHAVQKGIRRKKIEPDLGARLLSLADAAMAELAPLRTGP